MDAFKQAMLSENPLEIPEVASLVASYLKGKDLANCVRASKRWRDLFLPHRWRFTQVGIKFNTTHRIGPPPDDIYYHRHLIQHLEFIGELAGLDKYHYPNIHTLKVDFSQGVKDPEQKISLELTEMFPALVTLHLYSVTVTPTSWDTLSTHPHIRNLCLSEIRINVECEPIFWKTCKKLESLELNDVFFDVGLLPTNVVFDRMRQLCISKATELDTTTQLDLMLRCPRLEDLNWFCYNISDGQIVPIHHPIWDGRWPHLNKL
jgi:hypothetical protein